MNRILSALAVTVSFSVIMVGASIGPAFADDQSIGSEAVVVEPTEVPTPDPTSAPDPTPTPDPTPVATPITDLVAPLVTQPIGSQFAQKGTFVWKSTSSGTVSVEPITGGTWSIDGYDYESVTGLPLEVGAHTVVFTPDPGFFVPEASVPQAGVLAENGRVEFTFTLVKGVDSGAAAKVTSSKAPTISGTAQVGKTLTAGIGTFNPAGAQVSYQWLLNGAAIASGGTGKTFTPASAAYVGKKLSVKVTATLTDYAMYSATSASTAAVKAGVLGFSTPTISGTAKVGYTLTAKPGGWTTGTALKYQWYVGGKAVSGATKSTLGVAAAYVGKTVQVKVTGSKSGYTTVAKSSKVTGKVAVGTLSAPTPTITGTAKVPSRLTAKPGTWTSGTTLRYQWYAGGKAVAGQRNSTFVLGAAQVGKVIAVKVTGSKSGYTTVVRTSKSTAKVAKGTLAGATPTIAGSAVVGTTLTAKRGTWTSGTAFKYYWYAGNSQIKGATKSTYKIPANLRGKTVYVRVVGTKAGYSDLGKNSARTAAVIQTKAWYTANSKNRSTYKIVITGLGTLSDDDHYRGDVDITTITYPDIDMITYDYAGAASYTKTFTLQNPPSWWSGLISVSADGGMYWTGSNWVYYKATVKIYKKPAGAPDAYYSLVKSATGSYVNLTVNH